MTKDSTGQNPPNSEYAMASAIARYVHIYEVRLCSTTADIHGDRNVLIQGSPWELHLDKRMSFEFNEEIKVLTVAANLSVKVLPQSQPDFPHFLQCSALYYLDYIFRVEGGPVGGERDRYFSAFANVNGLYNIWPYYRELVQSFSSRMGMPPVILPVYRVHESASKEVSAIPSLGQDEGRKLVKRSVKKKLLKKPLRS